MEWIRINIDTTVPAGSNILAWDGAFIYYGYAYDDGFIYSAVSDEKIAATHYMELPKPPKE